VSAIIRIGKRYTIVIPKEIRRKIGLNEGSLLLARVVDNKIILEPLPDDPFKVLDQLITEPYSEEVDEKRAEKWLLENAGR